MTSNLAEAVDPHAGKRNIDADTSIAERNHRAYMRSRDNGHTQWLASAEKCDRFYRGEQWDEADLQALKQAGRPALTINKILSTINTVAGEQRLRRADFQFKAGDDGLEENAIALTKLANAEAEANQFDYLESLVFTDGIIEDRGFFDIRMNWDHDMRGNMEISRADNRAILIDSDATDYDPTKWRGIIETEWLSLDEIEDEYGADKANALRAHAVNGDYYQYDSFRFTRQTFGNEGDTDGPDWFTPIEDDDERELKSVRVLSRQHYQYVKMHYLVEPTGKLRELPVGTTAKEAKALGKKFGLMTFTKNMKKVRWTITADRVTLHDEWSPYRTFTLIPYFPIFRQGRALGLVRNLLSPQEYLNKLSSQELHIVNTTANSGYIVEKGSLANMTVDELARSGSKTGVVIEYNPGRKAPEKIQSNSIPTGVDRITQMAAINIKEISGVNDSMLGLENAEVSGVALDKKRAGGMTQMQVPMDNLARTRWMVARKMLELFQDFYTDERVLNYTDINGNTRQVTVNEVQDDGSVQTDITYGRYQIVISTAPARDTFNDSQFAELLNMRNIGVQIPDHRVIEKSNIADKQEIANEVKQLQGFGEPTQEEAQVMQLQQQIGLETLVAELEKTRAEIEQMRAKAMNLVVDAQNKAGEPQRELERLEAEIATKEREFELRQRLALLSATSKLDNIELNNQGQVQRQLVQTLSQAKLQANTPNERSPNATT